MRYSVFFVGLLLLMGSSVSAQTYEVELDKAEIRSSPKDKAIGSLLQGTTIEGLEKQGNWLKFRMEGWIYIPSVKRVAGPAAGDAVDGYKNVTPEQMNADPSNFKGQKIRLVGIKYYGSQQGAQDNIKVSLGSSGIGYIPVSQADQLSTLERYQAITVRGEVLDVIGSSLYFMRIDQIEN
jgi:hypothetical protein